MPRKTAKYHHVVHVAHYFPDLSLAHGVSCSLLRLLRALLASRRRWHWADYGERKALHRRRRSAVRFL